LTAKNRGRYDRGALRYPSDLSGDEWALAEPLIATRGFMRLIPADDMARRFPRAWVHLRRREQDLRNRRRNSVASESPVKRRDLGTPPETVK
jgi:hypothetical protein